MTLLVVRSIEEDEYLEKNENPRDIVDWLGEDVCHADVKSHMDRDGEEEDDWCEEVEQVCDEDKVTLQLKERYLVCYLNYFTDTRCCEFINQRIGRSSNVEKPLSGREWSNRGNLYIRYDGLGKVGGGTFILCREIRDYVELSLRESGESSGWCLF